MHGQRRADYKARQKDPQVAAKLEQKAQQWRQLTAQLPQAPAHVAWELTETLLRVNPDPLYLWNLRKKMFLEKSQEGDDDNESLIDKSLSLTAAALKNNPKSYGAWFHRKWVLCQAARMAETDATTQILKDLFREELRLTEVFLQRDERNFHCWNYRRFVVSLQMRPSADGTWCLLSQQKQGKDVQLLQKVMGAQIVLPQKKLNCDETRRSAEGGTAAAHLLQAEWEFTRAKIAQNFSNFSAFHYRSKLLLILWPRVDLNEELQLVEDAIYTEPDDQTAWWYQAFLLDTIAQHSDAASYYGRLKQHLEALNELAEEVAECKWVWLGQIACLKLLPDTKGKRRALWEALVDMDPDRKARYQHMLAKLEREE